nr:hypothetical protein [Chitinophagaceae bacterium]
MVTKAQFNALSNVVTKKIPTKSTIVLDQKKIVPNTIIVENIDASSYVFNQQNSTLQWIKAIDVDSVWISFR